MSAWLIRFAINHPCRLTYVAAELLRPRPAERFRNAWFQIRHWDDPEAWLKHLGDDNGAVR